MATDDNTTTVIVKIDPDGDIIFELSSDQAVKTHLLISSKVLSLVSPVLGKMFEWEFRAQQSDNPSSKQRPSVIPLPEDDMEAFILLAKITHHKMDGVPENLELDCLIEFATLCHKYDCVKAVTHSSLLWLRVDTADYSPEDLNKLLFAAYILDIPHVFMRVSRIILFNHPGHFLNLPGFTHEDLIPRKLLLGMFLFLEQNKPKEGLYHLLPVTLTESKPTKKAIFTAMHTKYLFELMEAFQRPMEEPLFTICEYSSLVVTDYIRSLKRQGLWPMSSLLQQESISAILKTEIKEPVRQFCTKKRECLFCTSQKSFTIAEELRKAKEKFTNEKAGVCLDCVLTRGKSFGRGECRIKHPVQEIQISLAAR